MKNLTFSSHYARAILWGLEQQGLDTDVMTQAIINTRSRTLLKR